MGYIMKKRQTAMGMETTGAPLTVMAMPSRCLGHTRRNLAKQDSAHDAQEHPDGKVAFENAGHFTFVGIGSVVFHRLVFSLLSILAVKP
jgi:hypothetical protein